MRSKLFATVGALVAVAAASPLLAGSQDIPVEVAAAWAAVNDPTTTPAARDDAESVIMNELSPGMIPIVFASFAEPANGYTMREASANFRLGDMNAEFIAKSLSSHNGLAAATQIACARYRILLSLASSSRPLEERDRRLSDCLSGDPTSYQVYWLITLTSRIEGLDLFQDALLEYYAETANHEQTRGLAARELLRSPEGRARLYERLIQVMWSSRRGPELVVPSPLYLLTLTGDPEQATGPFDPRVVVLLTDEIQDQIASGRPMDQRIAKALMESTDTPPAPGEQRAPVPEVSTESQEAMKAAFLDWAARNSARLEAEAAAKAVEALEKQKADAPAGER